MSILFVKFSNYLAKNRRNAHAHGTAKAISTLSTSWTFSRRIGMQSSSSTQDILKRNFAGAEAYKIAIVHKGEIAKLWELMVYRM